MYSRFTIEIWEYLVSPLVSKNANIVYGIWFISGMGNTTGNIII